MFIYIPKSYHNFRFFIHIKYVVTFNIAVINKMYPFNNEGIFIKITSQVYYDVRTNFRIYINITFLNGYFLNHPIHQVSSTLTLLCTSWPVTVCLKASVFAVKVSPTGWYIPTSSSGKFHRKIMSTWILVKRYETGYSRYSVTKHWNLSYFYFKGS